MRKLVSIEKQNRADRQPILGYRGGLVAGRLYTFSGT